MNTLWINACVRAQSRTKQLADCLLRKLGAAAEELRLEDADLPRVDASFLEKRDALIAACRFDDPLFALARQFAQAEQIVIAAPYWDLSFPAALKQYFEQINVPGVTFVYTPEGIPRSLCRAKRLFYVTTAGGAFVPPDFGFGYVRALAQSFYGIEDVRLVQASGLDVVGANADRLLQEAVQEISRMPEEAPQRLAINQRDG